MQHTAPITQVFSPQVVEAAPPRPKHAAAQRDPMVPTLFHEEWWLDIATGGNYGIAEVKEHGKVIGRLPYFLRRRFGLEYSLPPPMTHFLGPAVDEGEGNPPTRLVKRLEVTKELIRQLPKAALYRYKCHRDITDTIAFQQENFISTVQFTFEVFPAPEEALWAGLRAKKRKKIRGAQETVTLSHLEDPAEFMRFYDANLTAKGIKNLCDETLCTRLIEACLTRDQGRIYAARDKQGRLVSAVLCVWDNTTSFYFMSSRIDGIHSGVGSLLAWEAMKEASARGLIFDFDGLNNKNGVLFFTEFGGIVSPRYIVTRTTPLGSVALAVKELSRESRFFY